ncbi:MAG: C25 family cysteine peptidase [Candidatus Krumholzibacteriia bacterium]
MVSSRLWSPRSTAPVLLLLAALCAGTGGAQAASGPLAVTAEGPDGVTIETGDLPGRWVARDFPGAAAAFFDYVVPGFSNLGEPGGPRTPRAGAWLVVPPGTRPVIEVVSERWESGEGRSLMVEPVPIILPGADPQGRFVSEVLVAPGQALPAGVDIPADAREAFATARSKARGQALSLGEVAWWRGRRVVPVQLVPVLHDAEGRATQVLNRGSWRVAFVPDKAAPAQDDPRAVKTTVRGDDRFGGAFLNPGLLAAGVTEAAHHGLAGRKSGLSAGGGKAVLLADEVRLPVSRTGLKRVTAAQLRDRGLLPATAVAEDEIRLYQRRYLGQAGAGEVIEVEVPIHMVGDGGDFAGDDSFLFYGLRLRDDTPYPGDLGDGPVEIPGAGDPRELNNGANIYWLAAATPRVGEAWARMESVTLPPVSGQPLAGYRRTEHFEEQVAFRENVPDESEDRVFTNNYNVAEAAIPMQPLWSPDPAGAEARLSVGVTGFSTLGRNLNFDLEVDGAALPLVRNQYLASMVEQTFSWNVAAGALDGTGAEVVMAKGDGELYLWSYLNWAELSYDALYRAGGGRLEFHTGQGVGTRPVKVTGFEDADLGAVEITDPHNPRVVALQPGNILAEEGSWTLSIAPDQVSDPRSFVAYDGWSSGGVPELSYIGAEVAAGRTDPTELTGPPPDLLVITHREFAPAVGRWVEHRRARSGGELEVKVVDVQDLYDHYSGGLHDPWAIKRFCADAVAEWGSWALMLVGDANENAREFGVQAAARGWSADWVPTHLHVQRALDYNPELLASDKWYACSQAGIAYPDDEDFPDRVAAPWDMYVGRFPCNSVAELDVMIDKVVAMESPAAGQDWRRRGIFFGDDRWSNGYGIDALSSLTYRIGERVFADSTRAHGRWWQDATPVTLEADTLFIEKWLDPLGPDPSENRRIETFQDYAEQYALQPLLQALNQGGLVAFYQGHGNMYVLSSEYWMQDQPGVSYRRDAAALNNTGAPWVFFGMGCHILDLAQNTVRIGSTSHERSLTEKFLVRPGAGAVAGYGSSGYEYITANSIMGSKIFHRWMFDPPVLADGGIGNVSSLPGSARAPRSRWVLGELMWAAEADLLTILGPSYREMLAQYILAGDPLMVLDAGPPQVTAEFRDQPGLALSGEVELRDVDGSNRRWVDLVARDEAGIDRLRFTDSSGADLTSQFVTETIPEGATDHRDVRYAVEVPIRPFEHVLSIDVFDTGAPLPTDRTWRLQLVVGMTETILVDGLPHDPGVFRFTPEVPARFDLVIESSAALAEDAVITLGSANLQLANVVITRVDAHDLEISFDATATDGVAEARRSVHLDVQESGGESVRTVYVLQEGPEVQTAGLGRVYNFPNPMADGTRFFLEGAGAGRGVIRVFSVAGRQVASIPVRPTPSLDNGIVPWDGRDDRGDELANGTYLYRVELQGPEGTLVSDMQRLVVMR